MLHITLSVSKKEFMSYSNNLVLTCDVNDDGSLTQLVERTLGIREIIGSIHSLFLEGWE